MGWEVAIAQLLGRTPIDQLKKNTTICPQSGDSLDRLLKRHESLHETGHIGSYF